MIRICRCHGRVSKGRIEERETEKNEKRILCLSNRRQSDLSTRHSSPLLDGQNTWFVLRAVHPSTRMDMTGHCNVNLVSTTASSKKNITRPPSQDTLDRVGLGGNAAQRASNLTSRGCESPQWDRTTTPIRTIHVSRTDVVSRNLDGLNRLRPAEGNSVMA